MRKLSELGSPKYSIGDIVYAEIGIHGRKYAGSIIGISYHWGSGEYDNDEWTYLVTRESYVDRLRESEISGIIPAKSKEQK